jgi:hypothetical protein
MNDGGDKKRATNRSRVVEPSWDESSKLLIMRDKLAPLPQNPAAVRPRAAAPAVRHRAWLRQAVKRGK